MYFVHNNQQTLLYCNIKLNLPLSINVLVASQVENVRELQKTKKKRQLSVDSIFTLYIQIAREQMKRKPIIAVTTSLAIETHTNRKSPSCSTL